MQQELQGLLGMKELEKHFERLGFWSLFATMLLLVMRSSCLALFLYGVCGVIAC
jgi:hypothetical protein